MSTEKPCIWCALTVMAVFFYVLYKFFEACGLFR